MRKLLVLCLAGALPCVAVAAEPSGLPPAPATLSTQALFDRAAAASNAEQWPQALADYDALERRVARTPRSLAIVRIRRGEALFQLARDEEAARLLRLGLANLPSNDPTLAEDRFLALSSLGTIAERALDFASARASYTAAASLATSPMARRSVEAALVRVTMFDDAPAAVALAQRLVAEIVADSTVKPALRAQYRTIKGRALLNRGEFAAARIELAKAMAELGGLTAVVDQADVAARADLALAALLLKDTDEARKLLAFTGAGHLKEVLPIGFEMEPPPCGGPDDLHPDDVAVVEFSIGANGAVSGASPVYVSRQGPAAQAFGRAVSGWAWTAEQAKTIPAFFRAAIRVELRCSTVSERPGITALLAAAADPWLHSHGIKALPTGSLSGAQLDVLRADLRRSEAAGPLSVTLLPALVGIAISKQTIYEESQSAIERAIAVAEQAHAPGTLLAALRIIRVSLARWDTMDEYRRSRLEALDTLTAIRARPEIAADAVAVAGVLIYQADMLATLKRRSEGLALLHAVAADGRLAPHDPFKVGALVRIAAIEAERNDLAAARAAYERTGLSAQQCALVDAEPSMQKSSIGSSTFPMEALAWHFEGWTRTEFDISADGRTTNIRAIASYPPFVFSTATVNGMKTTRYTQSYRPDGGLGCGGQRQTVRFQIPG